MKLIVVESPSKAKTLKGYLSSEYEVIASVGHFRDLPKSGIGIDENNNFNVTKWELDNEKINPVLKLIKKADEIYLAPDPDREGELIAWHLLEICKERNLLKNKNISRIEFNQVNKDTVLNAIKTPRKINENLVNAAIARRFLDRFFGYRISPITQRRTIFGKSAGRVQSPALRILANREMEIDKFIPEEFWDIEIILKNVKNQASVFKIFKDGEKKIDKLSFKNETMANEIVEKINKSDFVVSSIDKKEKKRNPYAPFSASTLLQDASSRLGFSSSLTTTIAQQLFDGSAYNNNEQGLITYPRSDFIVLTKEKISHCRKIIEKKYGPKYLPNKFNIYKNKAKFSQEAHEPINPVDLSLDPHSLKDKLNENQFKLYDLIWKRTIASQMSPSINQETIITVNANKFVLKASGTIPLFDGYKKVFNFDDDDKIEKLIPKFNEAEKLYLKKVGKKKNFTTPPRRYSEAGLIKKLEELGIGRPSTYASIIKKLKEKDYVQIKNKSMMPNAKGKILSKFLEIFFTEFVEYEFTASLEKRLDLITKAEIDWKVILKSFLEVLNKTVNDVEKKSITNVIDLINQESKELLKEQICPKCENGTLLIKFAYNGPFVGCSNYKKDDQGCKYSKSFSEDELSANLKDNEKVLGKHPNTGEDIIIKKGRYGLYLETKTNEQKLKRAAVPKNLSIEELNIQKSIDLLKLPREIGVHPETNNKIIAAIGPYGPYIKHDSKPKAVFVNLKDDDVLHIGLNRALELIKKKEDLNKGILIGIHPKSKNEIKIKKGKFGHFFEIINKDEKVDRFSIPRNIPIETITLDHALNIINEKKKKTKTK